jgi:hypothetical protein
MSQDPDIHNLSLPDVAQRCREESTRFFRSVFHDPRFCHEMFRRAILERVQHAWDLLHMQYEPEVIGWVKNNPDFEFCNEDATYFVNRAFEKFWRYMTPDRFANYPELGALLQCFKMCVNCEIVDYKRAKAHRLHFKSLPFKDGPSLPLLPDIGQTTGDDLERQAFWAWVQEHLHGEKEYQVIYCRFVLDLKPSEICERFPAEFPNVKAIYLLIQNILARLRRDPNAKNFFGNDD